MRSLRSSLTPFAAVLTSPVFAERAAPSIPTRAVAISRRQRETGDHRGVAAVSLANSRHTAHDDVLAAPSHFVPRVDVPSNRSATRGCR